MKTAIWLRLVVYVLIGAAVLIALLPLLVLLSLVRGGTGLGLCPGGIGTCHNPYTAAPELSLALTVGLFAVVAAIRVVMRMARRASSESYDVAEPPSSVRETR
ncbi:MAG: hypothetical protein WB239_17620 [Acidimicrobiia bacterium]